MNKLLRYMRGYRGAAVSAPFFKVLEALFELAIPLVVKRIVDIGIAAADRAYVGRMCALLVLLGAVGFGCTMIAQYFAASAAVGFAENLRTALFAHIQKLTFPELDRLGAATLTTRMTSDISQVQSGVNLTLRLFSRSPVIVFGSMIMAFTIDTKAALVFAVAIPVLCAVVFGIMLAGIPLYRKVQAALDRLLGITRENLSGARVIRAFADEPQELRRFRRQNEQLVASQKRAGKLSALMNPLTYLLINLAILALLRIGAIRAERGILSRGDVIALYNYLSQILIELIKLANLILQMTKAIACGDRIEQVLEEGGAGLPILPAGAPEGDDAVTFRNVGLTYEGASAEALSDLDFSVRTGEVVGIIGGTGAGKSSLAMLIPRFYDATRGRILIHGIDVRAYPTEKLRRTVGIVMQNAVLFRGTIRENLLCGNPNATDEMLWRALDIAQATDFVTEKGLDFPLTQGGRNLSGGQRQRLGIARTLVADPEILILDDSTSALDYATDARLRAALRAASEKRTLFLISERAATLRHADKILVLNEGKAVGIGSHEALLATCGLYREIYRSQFPEDAEVRA